jgi:hypothetical protein
MHAALEESYSGWLDKSRKSLILIKRGKVLWPS